MRLGFRSPASPITTIAATLAVSVPCLAIILWSLTAPASGTMSIASATGTLSIVNSKDGRAVLSASPMIPGQTASGTVSLRNSGSQPEALVLGSENLIDHPGAGAGRLSHRLHLVITNISGAGQSEVVYDGGLTALPQTRLGDWAPHQTRSYRFVVTFDSVGTGGADNAYQGSSASIGFRWTVS